MKFAIALLVAWVLSTPAAAETLSRLMTEEFAPYQFYEGEGDEQALTGISINIVKAIQTRVGDTSAIEVLPWSRALKLFKRKPNSALFSTARTPDREDQFKWVGPIADIRIVFFRRKGSGVDIKSVDEARQVGKIGVTKNVATHEALSAMGFDNLDVMQSGADERNLARLVKGRIDLWPTAYYAGIYSARNMGLLEQVEVVPDVDLMSGDLYIAFHPFTEDSLIATWQSALDDLRQEGTIDLIISQYDR